MSETEFVQISLERLRELEKIEADLPKQIENAIAEYKKNNLKRLHDRDKADPKSVNLRVKRYLEKHKDEINAKRREKRKKLKNLEEIDSYQANTKTFEEGNLTSQTESIPTEQKTICPTNYVRNKVSVVDAESALSANQPKNITVRVTRVHHPVQPILTQDVILRFDK